MKGETLADYECPRGSIRDFRFFLKDQVNGSLIDQYNFTDGLAHGQWPTVLFFTGPDGTGTEITSQVVRNISGDTIASASHKDPTASSGVWRQSQGVYWVRVEPQNSLAFDDYYMRVSFQPTSGNTWPEDFTFEVLVPGDVDATADVTVADIKAGWTTSLTDPQIEDLIDAATDEVYGFLEDGGIDPDTAFVNGLPRSVKRAIVDATRCMISGIDLSSGSRVRSVQEGSERLSFVTTVKEGLGYDPCGWRTRLDLGWLKQNAPGRQLAIGTVTRRVGHMVNAPEGASSDPDAVID